MITKAIDSYLQTILLKKEGLFNMNLDVVFSACQLADINLKNRTAVIIDVLRATSTMITAFAHGAEKIVPCLTPDDAFQILERENKNDCLLCGERNAVIISGFHLGNSPLDYTPKKIQGKTLVFSTTNGTKAILGARKAENVILGSIINGKAAAAQSLASKNDIILVCAGTKGIFSYDDLVAAGSIAFKITRLNPEIILSDSALTAIHIYERHKDNLSAGLALSVHGKRLLSLGLKDDIAFCAQEDIFEIAPIFKDNLIKKGF